MMKAFVTIGLTNYQLEKVTPEELDCHMRRGDLSPTGPEFYDDGNRVWPPAREGMRVFFYDVPRQLKREWTPENTPVEQGLQYLHIRSRESVKW